MPDFYTQRTHPRLTFEIFSNNIIQSLMTENSLTCTTQPTSGNSTPEIKQTHATTQKIRSSLLFQGVSQEAPSHSLKSVQFHFPSEMTEIEIEILPSVTIDEALRLALRRFSQFKVIDLDPSHYEVYVAKKNGQPKFDYPSYLGTQVVEKTGNKCFALVHVADTEIQIQKKNSVDQPTTPKRTSKRKNTDSPQRADPKGFNTYTNHLTDLNELRERKKALSKEIDHQSKKPEKKQSWFLTLLGCGCAKE